MIITGGGPSRAELHLRAVSPPFSAALGDQQGGGKADYFKLANCRILFYVISNYFFAWYSFHICRGWKSFICCVKSVCFFKKDFFQVSKDDYTFVKQESHGRKLKVTSIGACKEIVLIFCDFNTFLIASQILVLFLSLRFAITSPQRPLPLGETEGAFSTLLYIFKFDHHVCYSTE